jgi:serine/threonine-protein kinase
MFYQLLTGQLPFSADSMATLMYRIANEQHTPVLDLRSDLPKCAAHIVDRALDKDPDNRYRDGHEMARAIRECASSLGGNG